MATDLETELRWETELRAAFNALPGIVVTDVWVNEMALYGPDDAGCFSDPNLGFVQANLLELRTSDGQVFHFSCVQTDEAFAMHLRFATVDRQLYYDPGRGTFRTRRMHEFPLGQLSDLRIKAERRVEVQEVRMRIGEHEVFLRAGEVHEHIDGTLTVSDHEDSVLVFLDGETYSQLTFNEPVYRASYV